MQHCYFCPRRHGFRWGHFPLRVFQTAPRSGKHPASRNLVFPGIIRVSPRLVPQSLPCVRRGGGSRRLLAPTWEPQPLRAPGAPGSRRFPAITWDSSPTLWDERALPSLSRLGRHPQQIMSPVGTAFFRELAFGVPNKRRFCACWGDLQPERLKINPISHGETHGR